MPKCPNCGQETARTMDWACQWCGYPLLSKSYKKIPKTYKQLRAERAFKQRPSQPKPELIAEPELIPEPMPEPEPELIAEPEPIPEPVPEPEPEATPEPKAKPATEPQPESTPSNIGLTVEELYSTYRDKIEADEKLTDKILKVTGIVDKIVVNDIHEIYYIILTGAERKEEQRVRCTFDKKYGHELNQLTAGQTVTVQGKYDGYRINIILDNCVLIS